MGKTTFRGGQPIQINAAGQIRGVHSYRVIARRLKPLVQNRHALSAKSKDLQPNISGGWQRIGQDRLAVKGVGIARVERCRGLDEPVAPSTLTSYCCKTFAGIVVDEQDLCLSCLAGFYMQVPAISAAACGSIVSFGLDSSLWWVPVGRRRPLWPDRSRMGWALTSTLSRLVCTVNVFHAGSLA